MMDSINLAILGPFIYALLDVLKRLGLSGKYIALVSLLFAVGIAAAVAWYGTNFDPLAVLSNAGAIFLAIEGAYKNSKDFVLKKAQ